ncbi:MAG: alpha/beta hydrolase [Gemmatimonadaceae bacterium]|nr:alpha/beta hydrolase [Gemmatimonadaceae bacterium]
MRGEFVDVGAGRLYYYAAGTRGSGLPVVLLHGFPMSSRLWSHVVRDFPPGHRLVVADLPGFGRSDAPLSAAAGCSDHAELLSALLDDLTIDRAIIVGHGLGGGVAQAFAVQWPERVAGLGLVSSAAFGQRPRRMARMARALGPLARITPPALLAGLVHGSVARGFADPARSHLVLDSCLRQFTSPSGRDALIRHLAAIRHCDTGPWSARLAELRVPAVVVWGESDPFYPVALGERLQAVLRGSTLHVLPGASHFVPEDSPDALLRALAPLLEAVPVPP